MAAKYVVGIHGDTFVEAVVFSERLNHNEVAIPLFGSVDNIVSGGFCYYDDEKRCWVVYGKSTSLRVAPHPELDAYLLGVATGNLARLSAFDLDKPPFGNYSDDARELIKKRKAAPHVG